MMRYFSACHITRFARLATLALGSLLPVVAVNAQQSAVNTAPTNYALFSQTTQGRKEPKFVLRVDSYAYPQQTTYRQFESAGAPRTPEEVVARFAQLLLAPDANAEDFVTLYLPAKRDTAEKREKLSKRYLDFRDAARKLGAPKLEARYDFGRYSQINVSFPDADREFLKTDAGFLAQFGYIGALSSIERADDRAYIGSNFATNSDAAFVGQLAVSETPFDGKIALPYSVRVPNDSPATKNLHPVDILFDGTRLDVPLDGKTRTASPAVNFLQRAAQVIRANRPSDTLALWDESSAKEIRESNQKDSTQGNASTIEALLSETSHRVAFTMDFDEGSILFLSQPKASKPALETVIVVKENGDYKLSFETESGLNLGNLDRVFRAPYFQNYLLGIKAPQKSVAKPKEQSILKKANHSP